MLRRCNGLRLRRQSDGTTQRDFGCCGCEIRVGDCVAIERVDETNNMRREPSAYCARENQQAVAAAQKETEAAAARCEAAKEELAGASTPVAVDRATAKVSLLCN
jgi:hypothetical protein